MEWSEVINNPLLQNLPFKIELNKWGKILMSPASNNHGILQFDVGTIIKEEKKSGKIIIECSIQTADGVKVADVAWASDEFIAQHGRATPYSVAPEICVEVISPSNSKKEMQEKINLYLAKGAHEVWLVDQEGVITYFSYEGQIDQSKEI
ncbi:MAG TPA: Uma2 family endonuclease [Thiothrix sp.]|nr:Uma2 family endonuclease [Thiothrix sp.]